VLTVVTQSADLLPIQQHDSILLVEDDGAARKAMSALLRSAGYRIRAFATAEEALRGVLANDLPAIAIVDLNLPGMDGLELISRIKAIDPDVAAVLTTANDSPWLQVEILKQGVGYLRKPIDFEQLLQVLRN
jgi:two-component system, NtrC family, C4-dicarboxylate transport response regulator DctD